MKVITEYNPESSLRRAGCYCNSGSQETHRRSGAFLCHCGCITGNLENSNANHDIADNV